ncbi:mechanosensitive ion channel [Candidatus Woesearchaeota archaeon]|nr:mechanosensitive ion channel [Candidatus Woesearchaeota archaeon]
MEDFAAQSLLSTTDKLGYVLFKLKPIFSNLLVSVIIVLIGLIIGKIVGRVIEKILQEIELNESINKLIKIDLPLENFIGKTVQYIIFFIGIAFALDVLGLANIIGYIFSAIILLIILGSFLVSSKDFLPNIISGIKIYRKKLFAIGETIKVDSCEGKVVSFNLFETIIKTTSGDIIHIPNSFITQKIFVKRILRK